MFLEHVPGEPPLVKLLDFGLAKLAGDASAVGMTQSGALLGTPLYMSPEQCRGKGVDHRTDIYALGCISYELLCGRVPFPADNLGELMAAHLGEVPPSPRALWPAIPPPLDALLPAMLAKEPQARPSLAQIRGVIASVRGASRPTPMPGVPALEHARPTPMPTPAPIPMPAPSSHGLAASAPGMRAAPHVGAHAMSYAPYDARPPRSRRALIAGVAAALSVIAIVALAVVRQADGDRTEPPPAAVAATPPAATTEGTATPLVAEVATTTVNVATGDAGASASKDEAPRVNLGGAAGDAGASASKSEPPPENTATTAKPKQKKPPAPSATEQRGGSKAGADKPAADATVTERARYGTLTLDAKPACNIYVDGKPTGLRTPQAALKLRAGKARITLVNADAKIADSFVVEVAPDANVKVFKTYGSGATTINPFAKKSQSP